MTTLIHSISSGSGDLTVEQGSNAEGIPHGAMSAALSVKESQMPAIDNTSTEDKDLHDAIRLSQKDERERAMERSRE